MRLVAAFISLLGAGSAVAVAQVLASRVLAWVSVGLSAGTVLLTAAAVLVDRRA